MTELHLTVDKPITLSVNGRIFPLLLSDWEVIGLLQELRDRLPEGVPTAQETIQMARLAADGIDQMLGEGAMQALSGDAPVSLHTCLDWLLVVAEAALEACGDALASRYE